MICLNISCPQLKYISYLRSSCLFGIWSLHSYRRLTRFTQIRYFFSFSCRSFWLSRADSVWSSLCSSLLGIFQKTQPFFWSRWWCSGLRWVSQFWWRLHQSNGTHYDRLPLQLWSVLCRNREAHSCLTSTVASMLRFSLWRAWFRTHRS